MIKTIRLLPVIGTFAVSVAQAQIILDGSIHPTQALSGPNYSILEAYGSLSGNNLFYSFDTFNIFAGESATFYTTTPTLENVIARVTGGSASTIDGALSLVPAAGAPDFFFINPAGVIFGSGASLNVPGAFHVSTADYIRFAGGGNFYADLGAGSTLSSAAPEAFGFLGDTSSTYLTVDGATLSTNTAEGDISLVGGYVDIESATIETTGGGDINLIGTGTDATEVAIDNPGTANGDVDIYNSTVSTTTSTAMDAGDINISADRVWINNSWVAALALGDNNSGIININADLLDIRYTTIRSGSAYMDYDWILFYGTPVPATGGGGIFINAVNMYMNESYIYVIAVGDGQGGDILVNASSLDMDYSSISTSVMNSKGGSVSINAGSLDMKNESMISSDNWGLGEGGDIFVNADTLSLKHSWISSDVYNFWEIFGTPEDESGDITLLASGQSGSITVLAGDISISNWSSISMVNYTTVASPDSVIPKTLFIDANSIMMDGGSNITTNSVSNVDANDIVINYNDMLHLSNVSKITTIAADADGGSITITGGEILRLDDSIISTSVTGVTGNGGNIDINADLLLLNTGFVQANTTAANAAGGDVVINTDYLIASANTLLYGGSDVYPFEPYVYGYNVIQAAAPTGVSGNINISSPIVDISASMKGLTAQVMQKTDLAKSPCQTNNDSALLQEGRGGLAPNALNLMRAVSTGPAPVTIQTTSADISAEPYSTRECLSS